MTDMTDPPSAFAQMLGYDLVDWREGFARYEMAISGKLGNREGIVHGGVHATLLDSAMGISGCWTGEADARAVALTLSLNVQYIGKPRGARLICDARMTGGGRSIFYAEATLSDDLGTLVAKGSGVFKRRRTPDATDGQ
ncbi:phenylacetic acid degradation protein [Salipiger aestuarii]|nr:PaaI family thioesterase [Salipiger aestuarii]KAA8610201.1 phenylacetic acid degradation protein [Salipiger aestuarii]KAA8615989.1 phenylacetic acid degradation protein [Salipiger aestuarii]KAB2543401.1 phenylacetic acid degradation protein [Salipiger aestuarii]